MIQVKFLEQWRDLLVEEKVKLLGTPDFFLDGQIATLTTMLNVNKKVGSFKTLKSYLKAYRNGLQDRDTHVVYEANGEGR